MNFAAVIHQESYKNLNIKYVVTFFGGYLLQVGKYYVYVSTHVGTSSENV